MTQTALHLGLLHPALGEISPMGWDETLPSS